LTRAAGDIFAPPSESESLVYWRRFLNFLVCAAALPCMLSAAIFCFFEFNNVSLGKPDTEPECDIDIKSEGLRVIVHWALENASDVPLYREATPSTLREDDLTVRES
jgi:hypothetical protein